MIIPILGETLSSKDTEVSIFQESLGSSRIEKSLSGSKIKCVKPLCNDNIISDKANCTIHFQFTFVKIKSSYTQRYLGQVKI